MPDPVWPRADPLPARGLERRHTPETIRPLPAVQAVRLHRGPGAPPAEGSIFKKPFHYPFNPKVSPSKRQGSVGDKGKLVLVSLRQAVSEIRFPCGKREGQTLNGDYRHSCARMLGSGDVLTSRWLTQMTPWDLESRRRRLVHSLSTCRTSSPHTKNPQTKDL